MSELATELSRRMDKEHVKAFAAEKAGQLKQQAKDVATEKATEMKEHARETVMSKTMEIRERADSPKGWSLLGALVGAGVGSALMRKAFSAREDRSMGGRQLYGRDEYGQSWRYGAYGRRGVRPYDERTATGNLDTGDLSSSARVSGEALSMGGPDTGASVKDKAAEMKDRVVDKASELKERMAEHLPDKGELRGRAADVRGQAYSWFDRTLEERPILLALGGIALGIAASSFIPVTRRERRLMEPARQQLGERISEFGDRISDKLKGESESGGQELRQGSSEVGASRGISGSDIGASRGSLGTSGAGVSGDISSEEDRSQELSSPTGSRIPPLPPLDDMTKH